MIKDVKSFEKLLLTRKSFSVRKQDFITPPISLSLLSSGKTEGLHSFTLNQLWFRSKRRLCVL